MSDKKEFKVTVDSNLLEVGNIADEQMVKEDFKKALTIVLLSAISSAILTAVLFIM